MGDHSTFRIVIPDWFLVVMAALYCVDVALKVRLEYWKWRLSRTQRKAERLDL